MGNEFLSSDVNLVTCPSQPDVSEDRLAGRSGTIAQQVALLRVPGQKFFGQRCFLPNELYIATEIVASGFGVGEAGAQLPEHTQQYVRSARPPDPAPESRSRFMSLCIQTACALIICPHEPSASSFAG